MTIPSEDDLMLENRDGDDNLMPVQRELETVSKLTKEVVGLDPDEAFEIEFVPVTQGEIQELESKAKRQEDPENEDAEITPVEKEFVEDKLVKPDPESIPDKLYEVGDFQMAALTCIIAESQGADQREFRDTMEEAAQRVAQQRADELGAESFQEEEAEEQED